MDLSRLSGWLRILFAFSLTAAALLRATPAARGAELIRRDGRHIHLTTDLASTEEAETLVASFDAAVPQWAQFWGLPEGALAKWKVDAYVIRKKTEFTRRDLIPADVPEFPFGYAYGNQIFVLAQQSEYYTRHLLLHEGVHSLAFVHFGGAGPTWFREGTAELLATHRGSRSDTRINQIPLSRDDVPYWGRFKLMEQLRAKGAVPTLNTVMSYQPDPRGDVESYGWSWAAAMMLNQYPRYRDALVAAASRGRNEGPEFNRQLMQDLRGQMPILAARWRVMCDGLDYGFDWSREQVALSARDPKWDGRPLDIEVEADQGWQSTGVRIPGRTRLRISASGQITLANTTKPWVSQPPGITFQYHRGRPLGQLLVTVLPNAMDPGAKRIEPLQVLSVDRDLVLEIDRYSWVLMRVNDRPGAALSDNQGSYQVRVEVARK